MTEFEIEDIAGTMIPYRGLQILSVGPMKRLVWKWKVNGTLRKHSEIIDGGNSLTPTVLRVILVAAIKDILNKFPDEDFPPL
ncbi:hypothetical protein [Yersinia kristensenii]|uniref:Uncharacterized protein n=1 Tax=Yersinia kristensenii TaxID=28152 RepID=A0AB73P862_YERKR|nr:hypothetical protein [Yersinia kristensenii]OVZ83872.1 hypothetical protein CBW52_01750 [Yersinia kristensenii]